MCLSFSFALYLPGPHISPLSAVSGPPRSPALELVIIDYSCFGALSVASNVHDRSYLHPPPPAEDPIPELYSRIFVDQAAILKVAASPAAAAEADFAPATLDTDAAAAAHGHSSAPSPAPRIPSLPPAPSPAPRLPAALASQSDDEEGEAEEAALREQINLLRRAANAVSAVQRRIAAPVTSSLRSLASNVPSFYPLGRNMVVLESGERRCALSFTKISSVFHSILTHYMD